MSEGKDRFMAMLKSKTKGKSPIGPSDEVEKEMKDKTPSKKKSLFSKKDKKK